MAALVFLDTSDGAVRTYMLACVTRGTSWAAAASVLAALVLSALSTAPAARAQGQVFGRIPCVLGPAQGGVRFCQGSIATRVASFDGVPLDVNVALPPQTQGVDGNYPLIVRLHGFGGHKNGFDSDTVAMAQRGYAVLSYSARGFGDSCGSAASRAADPTGCAQGWVHLADERYEVRDTQQLAGLLADEGVCDPLRVGVTGESYGGGQALALATLRNRVMLPNGALAPWRSPGRQLPMEVAAAAPVAGWSDLGYSLFPNGRTLDSSLISPPADLFPVGVEKQSSVASLFAQGLAEGGFYAPQALPQGFESDLRTWFAELNGGEPYDSNAAVQATVQQLARYHSPYYLLDATPPAALLIANGWNDDLFGPDEALRYTEKAARLNPPPPIALMFSDVGHPRATNKPADLNRLKANILAWFDSYLKQAGPPPFLGVQAMTTTCPKSAPSAGPFQAPSWPALHPQTVRFGSASAQTIDSAGWDASVSLAVDPLFASQSGTGACATTRANDLTGVATYRLPPSPGYTLLGSPTVTADYQVDGAFPEIAARLWDVDPRTNAQTLVARALYRPNQAGTQTFQLHANGWRFSPGHVPKLELMGEDPTYARTSNGQFSILVRNLDLRLPTDDQPPG